VLHLYDDCVGEQAPAPGLLLFHGLSPCDSVPLTQNIKLTTNKQFYSVTPSNCEKSFSINMQAKFEVNDKSEKTPKQFKLPTVPTKVNIEKIGTHPRFLGQ
jgi:hypothetical protein